MAFVKPEVTSRSPHGSVFAADPYSFAIAHRRLAWMLRLMTVIAVVLAISVVVLGNAIATLVPLKTTEIALVRADPEDDRLYRIEPISPQVDGFEVMMEAKARRYVKLLLEIDTVTQDERFQEAFAMTGKAFFQRFKQERFSKIEQSLKDGLQRKIQIETVTKVDAIEGGWKYAVDFTQTDFQNGRQIEQRSLRAYLAMTLLPQEIREADRYTNPLGVTVTDLVLKERTNP